MSVASFAPNIMMSLSIAMSIDYSLFLLTRFRDDFKRLVREGRTKHKDGGDEREMMESVHKAVRSMILHSGKIILVSGSTLAVSFLGLALFPMVVPS